MVGGFHGMLLLSAKRHRISCMMGRHLMRGGSEYHFWPGYSVWSDGFIFPFHCSRLVATASVRQQRLARFFPWLCDVHAGGIWKGDIWVSDMEELEKMDAFEVHAKRLNAKEVITAMNGEN